MPQLPLTAPDLCSLHTWHSSGGPRATTEAFLPPWATPDETSGDPQPYPSMLALSPMLSLPQMVSDDQQGLEHVPVIDLVAWSPR